MNPEPSLETRIVRGLFALVLVAFVAAERASGPLDASGRAAATARSKDSSTAPAAQLTVAFR